MRARAALAAARARLAAAGIDTPELDARLLLDHALGPGAARPGRDDPALSPEAIERHEAALRRRLAGEPVSRILGRRAFWTLDLAIGPDTLDPRPDTETVVEVALAALAPGAGRVLDLGTGSGAILRALLAERPGRVGVGVDLSDGAARVARANALAAGLANRAWFVVGDWDAAVTGRFDAMVSNPPYIASAEIDTLAREVRDHDPRRALDGGPDGLSPYPGLVLEIGETQGAAVLAMVAAGGLVDPRLTRDLAGNDRVVSARQRAFA